MDFCLQKDKLERLERELVDSSSTNKDDKDAAQLKRLKQDYETKLAEQEEVSTLLTSIIKQNTELYIKNWKFLGGRLDGGHQ